MKLELSGKIFAK